MSRLEEFRKRRQEIGEKYLHDLETIKDPIEALVIELGSALRLLFDEMDALIELYENHTPTEKGGD